MKKNLLTALAFAVTFTAVHAQQSWVSVYKDSVKIYTPIDMAVDIYGNTYITGYTNLPGVYYHNHFFVQMVGADGQFKWERTFPDVSFDSTDAGVAVATDTLGNIYVTGDRGDTTCQFCAAPLYSNIFVIKYDTLGNQKWIYRAQRPDSTQQYVRDIAVSKTGMPYLTGSEQKYDHKKGRYISKLIAIRLMKTGEANWQKYVPAASEGNGIAVDANNNALIATADVNDFQLQHNMVVKLNPAGNLVFKAIYSEPNKNGRNIFVGTDAEGNVYVNGNTDTIAFENNPHVITLKYSPSGTLLWYKKEKDHTYTGRNIFGAFTTDASGNVYAASYVHINSINDDWVISKYNTNGVQQFSAQNGSDINGEDRPCGIAVDNTGNIYVTGNYLSPYASGVYAYATAKYSPAGSLLNMAYYPKKLNRSNNYPVGIGIDKYNNIYVSGTSLSNVNNAALTSLATVKYSATSGINASRLIKDDIVTRHVFSVYPNPAIDVIHIEGMINTSAIVNIYTAAGAKIFCKQFMKDENKSVQVSAFDKGIYIITVIDESGRTETEKFIKE